MTIPLEVRLIKRVDKSEGCWNWTGQLDSKGYGLIAVNGHKKITTHRAAWAAFVGPIPKGLCVLHKCDNPRCVNPEHLYIGTMKDNTADMIRRGRARFGGRPGGFNRTRCKHGHSLTADNIYTINSKRGVIRVCKTCDKLRHRKEK